MSVFKNYNSQKAGQVNANAFPNMHPYPWDPIQRNIRSNPNIPSQPQRVQPHERGTFFDTSANGGGTLAPDMGDCGCSDCGGGGATPPMTASQAVTGNSYPGTTTSKVTRIMAPRVQPRTTAALRGVSPGTVRGSRNNVKLSLGSVMGGRGVR